MGLNAGISIRKIVKYKSEKEAHDMNIDKTGAFIAEMRKEKRLTQSELAKRLHVTDRAVSKWECGKGTPDSSLMLRLSEELGISVTELLCGEKVPPAEVAKRAEENSMSLLREIEKRRTYSEMTKEQQEELKKEFNETTSAKMWKNLNIITIFQAAVWIGLFLLSTFLNWHEIATTVLLVMMVINATLPIIIAIVRIMTFSLWLNLVKGIKEDKLKESSVA